MKPKIVISCEHAVNYVPPPYFHLFNDHKMLLNTHRGVDFGSQYIAQYLSKHLNCDFIQAMVTRLLIDCNRSLTHSRCFSEITKKLPAEEKKQLIAAYYLPYRNQVETIIKKYIGLGHQVWHLSIHSFTPVLNNTFRTADIGFLYDPHRKAEKKFAKQWKSILAKQTSYKVRMNYPYLGISDGFTTSLRKQWSDEEYLGIEVENNQILAQNQESLTALAMSLSQSIEALPGF